MDFCLETCDFSSESVLKSIQVLNLGVRSILESDTVLGQRDRPDRVGMGTDLLVWGGMEVIFVPMSLSSLTMTLVFP